MTTIPVQEAPVHVPRPSTPLRQRGASTVRRAERNAGLLLASPAL
ncbi:MAG: hypothetical protein JWP61_1559, partial [Friedmanniella sp.]|nr:hypothetical protein [Friedmanniella sp.]